MLDPQLLRQDPAKVVESLRKRGIELDLGPLKELEEKRKVIQAEVQSLQSERNSHARNVGQAKARGEDVSGLISEVEDLGDRLKVREAELGTVLAGIANIAEAIPNLPDGSVPDGMTEDENAEIRRVGEPTAFDFEPMDHVDLGAALGMLDFDSAARITGSRFVVMRDALPRLQRAITQFMLDLHTTEHGYTEVYVPYIVNQDSLFGTGQLPKFREDQFQLAGDEGYFLIPTAEVPVTNLLRDRILEPGQLPARYVCHTPCFRREAGSYGKDTRGMIRQHQFEKVELVHAVRPEESYETLELLTANAEEVLKRLELPYRVVALCGGDLGFSAAKTYDIEVWLPGQGRYREISSCSNFESFQARRMRARWRNPQTGKPEFLHTLNGSGLAVGRTLVAILENCQNGDGSVTVPQCLRGYMGGANRIGGEGRV